MTLFAAPLLLPPATQPAPALWRVLVLPPAQAESAAAAARGLLQCWQGMQAHAAALNAAINAATNATTDAAADPGARTRWHIVAIVPPAAASQPLHASALPEVLQPLAAALAPHWQGLLPGSHRITLPLQSQAQGQGRDCCSLQLTLWVGEAASWLRQQHITADALWLPAWPDVDAPQRPHTAKALARHCRMGTQLLATAEGARDWWPALRQSGFQQATDADADTGDSAAGRAALDTSLHTTLQATYAPAWQPRQRTASGPTPVAEAGHALVIGAGLAGSATARSLAERGWRVTVLAAGHAPADGASALPAGLFCPHVSPDDSILSRLSRSGVRMTLQRLRALSSLCVPGQDWSPSGVLEHCTDGGTGLPPAWAQAHAHPGHTWSRPASAAQLHTAGLPADTNACWHAAAGWVRPAQLVQAQLAHPRIRFQGNSPVAQLQPLPGGAGWQARSAQGEVLAQADIAVLASGPGTAALLAQLPSGHAPATAWPLQPIRGQITWGWHSAAHAQQLPPFPVNGHGNLVPCVPHAQPSGVPAPASATPAPPRSFWVMGSTFERDITTLPASPHDQAAAHAVNHGKLSTLLPAAGAALAPHFGPPHAQPTWANIRIASHDRLPVVGPVPSNSGAAAPGLWVNTAMGSRGLTLSVLCGELLAARLHDEPLPLEAALAQHLASERLGK